MFFMIDLHFIGCNVYIFILDDFSVLGGLENCVINSSVKWRCNMATDYDLDDKDNSLFA